MNDGATYRGTDRSVLDAAYDNRRAVPDFAAWLEACRQRSRRLRASRACRIDLPYGPRARQRIDFFPAAAPGAPLLVFIHGGYWQSSDKESHSYVAEGPLACGFAVALVGYTLAPEADIDGIVAEIDEALDWLASHATRLGADPERLCVCGHSAGAHLAAMMLSKASLAAAIAVSGIFDLEPIRLSSLNDKLGLTPDSARRNSPLHRLPAARPQLIIAAGARELPELRRQSEDYAAALAHRGMAARHLLLEGHDHFSVLEELARPEGVLCDTLCAFAGLTAGSRLPA